MTIETLPFEHKPRNSIANNLDKINELVDWANLDSYVWASASGELVTVDDASSLKGLTVDGRSAQDGTPTPDAPVPVQVVGGLSMPSDIAWRQGGVSISTGIEGSDTNRIHTAMFEIIPGADYIVGVTNSAYNFSVRLFRNNTFTTSSFVYGDSAWKSAAETYNNQDAKFMCVVVRRSNNTIITPSNGAEVGLHANTEYIGLQINDTTTPIDLQGNMLASLPDGTRDELHVDSVGRVWIEKRVGHTTQAVTDGVTGTVGTDVLSSTGLIADDADVWYKQATSQTIDLGYIIPPAIPSESVVTVSASLTPEFTLEWWVDDGITTLVNDLIAYVDYKTEG